MVATFPQKRMRDSLLPLTDFSSCDSLFGRAKNRGRNTESQNISPCVLSTLTIEEWETADSVQACCMGECESTEAGELVRSHASVAHEGVNP